MLLLVDSVSYTYKSGTRTFDWADGDVGDGLAKFGRARCRMAGVQEEFGNRLEDGYMANLGTLPRTAPSRA